MVRIKHRYLLVNILYPDPQTSNVKHVQASQQNVVPYNVQFRQPSSDRLTVQILLRLIRDNIEELFGDYGSGKVSGSLQIKYWSPATSTAIIRVAREHYRLVWAALTFTTRLPRPIEQACVIQVVRVSGTIRKSEEEAIRRARLHIRRAQQAARNGVSLIANNSQAVMEGTKSDDVDDVDDADLFDGIEDEDEDEEMAEED